jgi:hypothetical protein
MRRDLGIVRKIIFKWMFEKYDVTRYGPFAVSYAHSNELQGYIKGGELLRRLSKSGFEEEPAL